MTRRACRADTLHDAAEMVPSHARCDDVYLLVERIVTLQRREEDTPEPSLEKKSIRCVPSAGWEDHYGTSPHQPE